MRQAVSHSVTVPGRQWASLHILLAPRYILLVCRDEDMELSKRTHFLLTEFDCTVSEFES